MQASGTRMTPPYMSGLRESCKLCCFVTSQEQHSRCDSDVTVCTPMLGLLKVLSQCDVSRCYLASRYISGLERQPPGAHVPWMQVAVHTLRCTVKDRRKNKTSKRVPCSASDRNLVHRAVTAAMQLYLGTTSACKFACYLVSFISSVDSLARWDRTMPYRAATARQTNENPSVASRSQPTSRAADPVRMTWCSDRAQCLVILQWK